MRYMDAGYTNCFMMNQYADSLAPHAFFAEATITRESSETISAEYMQPQCPGFMSFCRFWKNPSTECRPMITNADTVD